VPKRETYKRLTFVINCNLVSEFVGWRINYKNMHGMNNKNPRHLVFSLSTSEPAERRLIHFVRIICSALQFPSLLSFSQQ